MIHEPAALSAGFSYGIGNCAKSTRRLCCMDTRKMAIGEQPPVGVAHFLIFGF